MLLLSAVNQAMGVQVATAVLAEAVREDLVRLVKIAVAVLRRKERKVVKLNQVCLSDYEIGNLICS